MARSLTEAHKQKLAEGRALKRVQEELDELARYGAWMKWLHDESLAFSAQLRARFAEQDDYDALHEEWHQTLLAMPQVPKSTTFWMMRGDDSEAEGEEDEDVDTR